MNLHTNSLLQNGKYKIERELGHGGFGITYLATQTGLNRKVAIKEFFMREYCERNAVTSQVSIGSSGSREIVDKFRHKFIKEAQTIAALHHPNIIAIYDIFEENGTAYYVMEYHNEGSLNDLVKTGALSADEALRYIRQIAGALSYCHERKMLHLDVKPGNILLQTNNAILIDFGLAKHYDDEGEQTSSTPVGISKGYAPLEQYNKGGVDAFTPVTDIYSLGATLYKLVTGTTPPDANYINEEGVPSMPATVPANVQNAIKAAMQPRRKERPQSIAEFLDLLNSEETVSEETVFPDEVIVSEVIEEPEKPHPAPKKPVAQQKEPARSPLKKWLLPIIIVAAALLTFIFWPRGTENRVSNPTKNNTTVSGTISGHNYVDLGLSVKWATCNIGANSPEDYGDYFAWGETTTKSEYTEENSKTFNVDIGNIESYAEDAAGMLWAYGWRMPTKAEWQELIDNCTWKWTKQGGNRGYKVTSKKNGNNIFLPAAGCRDGSKLISIDICGSYWSSTSSDSGTRQACALHFFLTQHYLEYNYRHYGLSIRPVIK